MPPTMVQSSKSVRKRIRAVAIIVRKFVFIHRFTQCEEKSPLIKAGPNVLAGFMLQPVNGPFKNDNSNI